MKRIVLLILLAFIPFLTQCGRTSDIQKLTLTGSSTVAPLAAELGKRFEKSHPNVQIDVQAGGSARGIADARSGLANIGMASRELKADEQDLTAHTIGLDGISIILQASNPISELSDTQIIDIYTGKIRNWAEVGGADQQIVVINKAEGRSTLELFLGYFHLEAPQVRADIVIGDNEQGIQTVAGNAAAIGYVSIGSAEYAATHGTAIKLLPLHGVAASSQTVLNGSFPLKRPLNLVTKGAVSGLAEQFIQFAQSEQVHDLVVGQYFIPVNRQ